MELKELGPILGLVKEKRTDNDIDSIELGAPTKPGGKTKVYFNAVDLMNRKHSPGVVATMPADVFISEYAMAVASVRDALITNGFGE